MYGEDVVKVKLQKIPKVLNTKLMEDREATEDKTTEGEGIPEVKLKGEATKGATEGEATDDSRCYRK